MPVKTATNTKTAKNTTTSANVILAQMPTKNPKKVKKTDFNLLQFLLQHHAKDQVYYMPVPANTSWNHMLGRSNIYDSSAMLFLVDKDNTILYIGQTNNVYDWCVTTNQTKPNMPVATVYAVCNKNPGMFVHSVTAYRATFKPKFNSSRNTRFVFSPVNVVLNTAPTTVSAQWIRDNPDATYTQFVHKFSIAEMRKLCKLYCNSRYSYAVLKNYLLTNK